MRKEIDLGIQKKMKSESAVPGVSAVEKLKAWKEQCSSKADLLNNSSLSYTLLSSVAVPLFRKEYYIVIDYSCCWHVSFAGRCVCMLCISDTFTITRETYVWARLKFKRLDVIHTCIYIHSQHLSLGFPVGRVSLLHVSEEQPSHR